MRKAKPNETNEETEKRWRSLGKDFFYRLIRIYGSPHSTGGIYKDIEEQNAEEYRRLRRHPECLDNLDKLLDKETAPTLADEGLSVIGN